MGNSLADWLALRETADFASRSTMLMQRVIEAVGQHDPLRVLDLGTGTGSNLRYLVERLRGNQRWHLVDRDPDLLDRVSTRTNDWCADRRCQTRLTAGGFRVSGNGFTCDVETTRLNLRTLDHDALFAGRHLVTASALLDLVSQPWLDALAHHCRDVGAAALFAITYNGRSTSSPTEPEDDHVLALFNRHQRTDKGLGGVAAGPDAVHAAARAFTAVGYEVETAPSDWVIEPDAREFQRQLIDGWAFAAGEIAPEESGAIEDWRRRRIRHVDAGRSRIIVGHDDLGAWRAR